MAMEMKKLGYSPNKIRTEVLKTLKATPEYAKEVEKNTLEYKKAVDKIIKDTVARAKEEGNQLVANSGNMSWVNDMSVWESNGVPLTDNTFLPVLVKAIQAQISDGIMNLTKTTGFKGMFGYESVRNMYNRVLNDAVLKVTTGTFSRDTAIRDAIHEMAQSGLRTIDYENGRSVQLDSAVRLCVRTGCAQLSAKITDENIKASGQNLVQVSSHWGARNRGTGIENHEEWQGKVYYIEPQHDYVEEAKRIHQDSIEDLWEKTGYSVDGAHENNPLGLYGYNCRHRLYPFYEGVSEPLVFPPEPSPVVVDGKELDWYAQSQKMRQMEWKIRNLKREKEALKKFGADKESIAKVDVKISEASRKYNQFCKDIDQRPRTENVRYEVGSTDLHKTQAYKDYVSVKNIANVDKDVKIDIDELTPCLRRLSDNKIVSTTVENIKPKKGQFKDWEFDWNEPFKNGYIIRGIKAENDERIQGMVAMMPHADAQAVYVDIVESAPFNNPHNKNFVKKEYSGVGGHLFAEAVGQSMKYGFDGVVYFKSKSDLIEHYQKELGAQLYDEKERMMVIDERNAKELYERYYHQ